MSSKNKLPKLFIVLPLLIAALTLAFHFLKSQKIKQSLRVVVESNSLPETQHNFLPESKPASEIQASAAEITLHSPFQFSESLPGASLLVLGKKINLNQATLKDLVALPGIGEKLAHVILEYRQKKGPFKKIEDLMRVKGIKTKKFSRVKKYISVTDEDK